MRWKVYPRSSPEARILRKGTFEDAPRRGMESPCLTFSGSVDEDGYGRVHDRGKRRKAHRVAWEMEHGSAEGLVLRHRCDNPACFRPSHVLAGTHADNVADRVAKGRSAFGKRNGNSTEVRSVRESSSRRE